MQMQTPLLSCTRNPMTVVFSGYQVPSLLVFSSYGVNGLSMSVENVDFLPHISEDDSRFILRSISVLLAKLFQPMRILLCLFDEAYVIDAPFAVTLCSSDPKMQRSCQLYKIYLVYAQTYAFLPNTLPLI